MKKNILTLVIISIVFITGCKKNNDELATLNALLVTQDAAQNISGQFVPNEILVKFKAGAGEKSRTQTLSFINAKVSEHILTKTMERLGDNNGIYLVHTDMDVNTAMARMKGESNIEYAEPNWIYNHYSTSNDPYYTDGSLWGMYGPNTTPANQYGSQAGAAWANGHTGLKTVTVGVIDEGIQFTHPDLSGQVWTNPFDAVDGIDNDNNGYVDDIHGWDFANNDNTIYDGGARGSLDKHGTHVSGTIGGIGGNGIGVAGVNWAVTIISAKFLGRNGGTTANAIKAVDYLTDLKSRHGINLVASNNSWGGGGFSQALKDAIDRAGAKEILFVAAAGNDGLNTETSLSYPSGYTSANIIAVAAIDNAGNLASFSNYAATAVDLGAPGVAINSTMAFNTYASYSGTSMATPHVTGGAALYASTHPGSTAAAIKSAILGAAVSTPSLTGKCVTGGRLNVSGF